MERTDGGGRLQSPATSHGDVDYSPASTMSTEPSAFEVTGFLLAASGIKSVWHEWLEVL